MTIQNVEREAPALMALLSEKAAAVKGGATVPPNVIAIGPEPATDPDDDYTITGQWMWDTNSGSSTLVAALVKTDEGQDKPHRNLTAFLVEKPVGFGGVAPALLIPGKLDKLGYRSIDTTELVFDGCRSSGAVVLGGALGRGFVQMMDGIEVGRAEMATNVEACEPDDGQRRVA